MELATTLRIVETYPELIGYAKKLFPKDDSKTVTLIKELEKNKGGKRGQREEKGDRHVYYRGYLSPCRIGS
jgi:hypothetical protein